MRINNKMMTFIIKKKRKRCGQVLLVVNWFNESSMPLVKELKPHPSGSI